MLTTPPPAARRSLPFWPFPIAFTQLPILPTSTPSFLFSYASSPRMSQHCSLFDQAAQPNSWEGLQQPPDSVQPRHRDKLANECFNFGNIFRAFAKDGRTPPGCLKSVAQPASVGLRRLFGLVAR